MPEYKKDNPLILVFDDSSSYNFDSEIVKEYKKELDEGFLFINDINVNSFSNGQDGKITVVGSEIVILCDNIDLCSIITKNKNSKDVIVLIHREDKGQLAALKELNFNIVSYLIASHGSAEDNVFNKYLLDVYKAAKSDNKEIYKQAYRAFKACFFNILPQQIIFNHLCYIGRKIQLKHSIDETAFECKEDKRDFWSDIENGEAWKTKFIDKKAKIKDFLKNLEDFNETVLKPEINTRWLEA